jgi:hypothetical protein
MTTFDEREKAFESKFKRDQDLQFKVNNRRNRLLGQWVAAQLNKVGADADAYAKDVVMSDFEKAGDDDVLQKVLGDLKAAGKPADAAAIRKQMDKLVDEAKKQVMEESK